MRIKMKFKEVALRVTRFCFKDLTKLKGSERKDCQAFQKFVECMILPAGTKQYTDEMFNLYVYDALVRVDLAKQKDEKQLAKFETKMDKQIKKFIAKKKRSNFINNTINWIVGNKKVKGEKK